MDAISIASDTTIRRTPGLVASEFGGELVLLDLDGGAYYSFDAITSRIWELLESEPTFAELVEGLIQEFDVPREVCEKDSRELLVRLAAKGLIAAQ